MELCDETVTCSFAGREINLPDTTSNQTNVNGKLMLFRAGRLTQEWYLAHFLHDELHQRLEQLAFAMLSHHRTYYWL